MHKDPLIRALRDALDPDAQIAIRSKRSGLPPDMAEGIVLHDISRPVETILKQTQEFEGGPGFMVQMDNGYSGFHANEASIALCKWVLARRLRPRRQLRSSNRLSGQSRRRVPAYLHFGASGLLLLSNFRAD